MVTGDDIIGSWLMVDRGTDSAEDQAQALARYGDDPQGFMIFAPDGWMNAIVCWGGRPSLSGDPAWHADASDDEKARAFDTYLSYGGRWTVEDSTLTTKVTHALNPGWVGGEQVRQLEMTSDGHLILKLSRAWPDGRVMHGWVRWRRATA
ncbi:MAG: lipocalin-like domain-containing protein [Alphaproteobacteria bacterium]|nr:lipocalin-like domain-containing protein [Alphaproteobacteria bacterium]